MFQTFGIEDKNQLRTSGVGLGLTTAKILTHALQGAISLDSTKELGTKVTFSALTKLSRSAIKASKILEESQKLEKTHDLNLPKKIYDELAINLLEE